MATFYAGRHERGPAHRARPDRRTRPRSTSSSSAPTTPRRCSGTPTSAAAAGITFVADPSQQLAFADGPVHPQAHRGRGLPLHQRVRSAPHRAEDRLERGRHRGPGDDPRHHQGQGRRRHHRPAARSPSRSPSPARRVGPTPPASATPSAPASSPASPPGSATAAAPRSARCSRPTSSRPIGTQEYVLDKAAFLDRLAQAYGDDSAAEVEPHITCVEALTARTVNVPVPAGRAAAEPVGLSDRLRATRRRGPRRCRRRPRAGHAARGLPRRPLPHGARRRTAPGRSGWWSPEPRGVLVPGRLPRAPLPAGRPGPASRSASTPPSPRSCASVRRPRARGPLDHRRDHRGLHRAAPARLGAQRRDVARRRPRRRALRHRDRRAVRR